MDGVEDEITRLRLDLFREKLKWNRLQTSKKSLMERLHHEQNIREFERITRSRVHGFVEEFEHLTRDSGALMLLNPTTGPTSSHSHGHGDLHQLIVQNTALIQHLVLKESSSSTDSKFNHARKMAIQTDNQSSVQDLFDDAEPKFSNAVFTKVPAWRAIGGPKIRTIVLGIIFLIRLRRFLEGYTATEDGKLKKDADFEQSETMIKNRMLQWVDLEEWMDRMVDMVDAGVQFMNKKGINKRPSDLDLFKLAARVEELVVMLARCDVYTLEVLLGTESLRFIADVVSREKEFPPDYLYSFEKEAIARVSDKQQGTLEQMMFLSTTLLHLLLDKILLRVDEFDIQNIEPDAMEALRYNNKMISLILYRIFRDVCEELGQPISHSSNQIFQKVAATLPLGDNIKNYSDDHLKNNLKRFGGKYHEWTELIQQWSASSITGLKSRFK